MTAALRRRISARRSRRWQTSCAAPPVAAAVRKRWLDPRRDWARMRMARAAEAGQLQPGVEPRAALALLYSPLYTPLLFGNDIPSRKDLDACVDLAARAIFRG